MPSSPEMFKVLTYKMSKITSGKKRYHCRAVREMLPRWKLLLDESKRLEKYVHDERMRCRTNNETEVSLRENILITANKVKSIMNEVSEKYAS